MPKKVLDNKYFEQIVDTSNDWIVSRTGIKERRKAPDTIATSDLATKAAILALKDANLTALEMDMIIVATVTPDMSFPSTACLVQKNLGAKNAIAYDIEAACSGFVFGITIAEQFIKTGMMKNILVIGAELLTKITDYKDRNTCILFGDGAGAAVISEKKGSKILATYIGSDGNGCELLYMPGGGTKAPASLETLDNSMHYIKMEGAEVFKFAIRIMDLAIEKALKLCNLKKKDIDCLIPHQANIRIIESAMKRLKLSKDKVFINVERYGNMSAASIAVALDEAKKCNMLLKDRNIVLVAFGGGLTWGSVVIKWA